MPGDLTIYSYVGSTRTAKALIAAQYNGIEINVSARRADLRPPRRKAAALFRDYKNYPCLRIITFQHKPHADNNLGEMRKRRGFRTPI